MLGRQLYPIAGAGVEPSSSTPVANLSADGISFRQRWRDRQKCRCAHSVVEL